MAESILGHNWHCVKSVRIRSYFGLHFLAFGMNTERYGVSLHIQSECGKMRTRITLNTDTFHAVWRTKFFLDMWFLQWYRTLLWTIFWSNKTQQWIKLLQKAKKTYLLNFGGILKNWKNFWTLQETHWKAASYGVSSGLLESSQHEDRLATFLSPTKVGLIIIFVCNWILDQ